MGGGRRGGLSYLRVYMLYAAALIMKDGGKMDKGAGGLSFFWLVLWC